jgi:integrase
MFPLLEKTDFEPKKTVGYYYGKTLQMKEVKTSTMIIYRNIYENHIKKYEDFLITDITTKFARDWVYGLKLSASTVRGVASVFRQIIDEALFDEAVDKNPFRQIKLPKLKKYEPQPYSDKEVKTILDNSKGWFHNLFGFLLLTGMRIGEACALEWDDIKDDHIVISKAIYDRVISTTKTGGVRKVPIFDSLRQFIEAQRLESASERVFDKAVGTKALRYQWLLLTTKCGMRGRVLYNTRHTFATRALDSGKFTISQIAQMLGHSTSKMLFDKYAKFIKSEKQEFDKSFSTLGTNLVTQGA